jgi:predicted naringenin-chalcone synthase
MTAFLCSIGTALPEHAIEQSDAARVAQELRVTERWLDALPALYRKSGVKHRGSVLLKGADGVGMSRQNFYGISSSESPFGPTTSERMEAYSEHAGPLLEQACKPALRSGGFEPSQISHLVTVSCTGFFSPGIDHWLIQQLGMPLTVQRTHVGFMGCHGLVNGLRVAQSIVTADPRARVLVGAVELCSLHQQYTEDPQQLVANALFADGAASAIVVGPNDGVPDAAWKLVSSHSCMIPDTMSHMGWCIGDFGFQMRLSPEVPAIIGSHLRVPVESWLGTLGLSVDAIDHWAIHPGGPRILDSVAAAMELADDQMQASRAVLSEHGNMSSPTVLFILERLGKESSAKGHCVLIAFGPGLHAEMILLSR